MSRRPVLDARIAVDLVVVAAVLGLSVADMASSASRHEPWERDADVLAYVLVVIGSVSLYWRRRAPIATLSIVTGVLVAIYLGEYGAYLSVLGLPALYAVAAHADHRARAWAAIVASCTVLLSTASISLLDTPQGFAYFTALSMLAFLVAAVAAGILMRNRERIFVDTERRAAEAEADRATAARRAVVVERNRIAREMHDVVAHGMSVIAVQAAAGREIVGTDPEKAAEVFARIERVGRESLSELRRMLGVLRETAGDEAQLRPQPGIADIADAVAAARATGSPTELAIEGAQRPLPPGLELAAFRIVQEALTNVRKHAGKSARATVRIAYEPGALVVDVSDDGSGAASALAGSGGGHGLIGMRERVEIYGGELASGPRPGGGFTVHAVLPLSADGSVRSSR